MPTGTALLDFGVFPGTSDASLAITGQTDIVAGSSVEAWIRPVATADHTVEEHLVETLRVFAANITAGVGFTIYGVNTSQLNEPSPPEPKPLFQLRTTSNTAVLWTAMPADAGEGRAGDRTSNGTRIWGLWSCSWAWI